MPPQPFFTVLHDLLDQEQDVRLEDLLLKAGEQTYGLLILLLTLPSLVPGLNAGLAPVGGLAVLVIGLQMARGIPHPWVPRRIRNLVLHKGILKAALARLEQGLARFTRPGTREPVHAAWVGSCVAWTGFLLAIPVPLPFANLLPACILCLLGASALEQRPAWAWAAALACLGNTLYFALSFRLILRALATLGG